MPRRISRFGGTTLRRSFMTNAYSPAICRWGPRDGPHTPSFGAPRRSRGARFLDMGAPTWPPYPLTFGAPRRSRGAPLYHAAPISRGSQQPAMFGHHAAVLDDADAGAREGFRGGVVADAELEPHGGGPPRESHDLGGVARQVLGPAEDVDDVDRLVEIAQRGDRHFAQHATA